MLIYPVVGFTGTQSGMTDQQEIYIREWLLEHIVLEVIHGGCIGADWEFDYIAASQSISRTVLPSNISHKQARCHGAQTIERTRPPLERNRIIVNRSDIILACPKESKEILRSGTWATIRYARPRKETIIIYPNGEIEYVQSQ